jgi:hypothetical protein
MVENAIVLIIVAAAAVFLVRQLIQTLVGREGGCQSGCGCDTASKQASKLGKRVDLVQLDTTSRQPPAK